MPLMNLAKVVALGAVVICLVSVTAEQAAAQWWNPKIFDTGPQFGGAHYDPFGNNFVIRSNRTSARASVMDPNRNWVDPGSKRWVDEIRTDGQGNQWRVRGWEWRSNGVPHGDLKRTRINQVAPGIQHQENERMLYSARGGQNNNSNNWLPAQ